MQKKKKTKRQYSKVCYKNIKRYEQRRKEKTHRVILGYVRFENLINNQSFLKGGILMRVHIPVQGEIETEKVIAGIEALKGLTELEFKEVVRAVDKYFKEKKEKLTFDVEVTEDEFLKKIKDYYRNSKGTILL